MQKENKAPNFKWLAVTLLIATGVFVLFVVAHSETKPAKAPDFVLKDLHGNQVKLSNYKGKVVLVNFWATWCPPCRAEIPDFISVYEKYKGRGFTILGISVDNTSTPGGQKMVSNFVAKAGITYPVLLSNNTVANDFGGVYAIPASFLIDGKGNIIKKYIGLLEKQRLEADLLPLLKG